MTVLKPVDIELLKNTGLVEISSILDPERYTNAEQVTTELGYVHRLTFPVIDVPQYQYLLSILNEIVDTDVRLRPYTMYATASNTIVLAFSEPEDAVLVEILKPSKAF